MVTCGNTICGEAILSARVEDTWEIFRSGQLSGEVQGPLHGVLTIPLTSRIGTGQRTAEPPLGSFHRQSADANAVVGEDHDCPCFQIIGDLAKVAEKRGRLVLGTPVALSEQDQARQ